MCSKPLFKVMCRRDELGHAYLCLCLELGIDRTANQHPPWVQDLMKKFCGAFKVGYYTRVTLHHAVLLQEPLPSVFFGGHIYCRIENMLNKV